MASPKIHFGDYAHYANKTACGLYVGEQICRQYWPMVTCKRCLASRTSDVVSPGTEVTDGEK